MLFPTKISYFAKFFMRTIDKLLTLGLRLNQEIHTSRLLMHGVDHTQRHPTSQSSNH
jgi:hypothetical protein